jgi:hypothetical protein
MVDLKTAVSMNTFVSTHSAFGTLLFSSVTKHCSNTPVRLLVDLTCLQLGHGLTVKDELSSASVKRTSRSL